MNDWDIPNEDFAKPIRKPKLLNLVDHYLTGSWEALGAGAPTLVALAQICSQALVDVPELDPLQLAPEAKAILYAARTRGIIEIKAVQTAFDVPSRLLAVYVELDEDQTVAFRDRSNPEVTARFLEGFRQLCTQGLIVHHVHRDFSLSATGFALARTVSKKEVDPWLNQATDLGLHD
jgi:hypothetical protein